LVARRHRDRRLIGIALVAGGLFQVLYGALNLGSGLVWGLEVSPAHAERLRGTFNNANHLALYLEMALAISFASAAAAIRRAGAILERRILWVGPWVLAWLVLFVGLAFTRSRAGLVAAILAAVAQGLVFAWTQRSWRLPLLVATLLSLGLVTVVLTGLQEGLGRLLATSRYELEIHTRFTAYAATIDLWLQFPWLGTGLGSFRDAFPLVQPADLTNVWTHAHSDILELLSTTGVLGAIVFAAGLISLLRRVFGGLSPEGRTEDRAAAVAAVGALAAPAVHSWFDFGLSIPANAIALAIVCGAAAGLERPARPPVD
jgi:O-antigen ligase